MRSLFYKFLSYAPDIFGRSRFRYYGSFCATVLAFNQNKITLRITINCYDNDKVAELLCFFIYVFALIGIAVYNHFFSTLICILTVFTALPTALSFLSYRSVTFGFLQEKRDQINTWYYNWKAILELAPILFVERTAVDAVDVQAFIADFLQKHALDFADVGSETRVLWMGLLASVLCHDVLVFTLLKFETAFLNFSKSLPISICKRLSRWVLTFAIILLPGWMFLIIPSGFDICTIINGFVFGLAGMLFLLTLLYFVKLKMDSYIRWLLFFLFFINLVNSCALLYDI